MILSETQEKCFKAAHQICVSLKKNPENFSFQCGKWIDLNNKMSFCCLICDEILNVSINHNTDDQNEIIYQHMKVHVDKLKAFI